jgi:hypothetical protein
VVGVYLNPPDKAVVLCMDEKSQIQPSSSRVTASGGLETPIAAGP